MSTKQDPALTLYLLNELVDLCWEWHDDSPTWPVWEAEKQILIAKHVLKLHPSDWAEYLKYTCPLAWIDAVYFWVVRDEGFGLHYGWEFERLGKWPRHREHYQKLFRHGIHKIICSQPHTFNTWIKLVGKEELKNALPNFLHHRSSVPYRGKVKFDKFPSGPLFKFDKIPKENLLKIVEPHRGSLAKLMKGGNMDGEVILLFFRHLLELGPEYASEMQEVVQSIDSKEGHMKYRYFPPDQLESLKEKLAKMELK